MAKIGRETCCQPQLLDACAQWQHGGKWSIRRPHRNCTIITARGRGQRQQVGGTCRETKPVCPLHTGLAR